MSGPLFRWFLILAAAIFGFGPAGVVRAFDFPPSAPVLTDGAGNSWPETRPDLTVRILARQEVSGVCSANSVEAVAYYPQGLGEAVDASLKQAVEESFTARIEALKNGFCDAEFCGAPSCGDWGFTRTFAVHEPSPGYVSVLFLTRGPSPRARDSGENTAYEVLRFRPDGEILALTDLFPRPELSLPRYLAYVREKWRAENGCRFPVSGENGSGPDRAEKPEIPDLGELERLIFTPEGAGLIFSPAEAGPCAAGSLVLELPKEDLLALGASGAIWGE